jgi:hypothetical protein
VLSFLDEHPDTPSLTLAKIIHKAHPVDFPDVEKARQVIRYYRGSIGAKNGKAVSSGKNPRHIGGGKRPYIPADETVDEVPLVLRPRTTTSA